MSKQPRLITTVTGLIKPSMDRPIIIGATFLQKLSELISNFKMKGENDVRQSQTLRILLF